MPIPELHSGQLPQGRWACTPADVQAAFVPDEDHPREAIWHDWITLTAVLRTIVGHIPSAWMSGSFFTDKAVPGDIDCLYLVDTEHFQRAMSRQDADSSLLWVIATSQAKSVLKLNVDSYILEWAPTPGPGRTSPSDYYESRGYWDDLWVRFRDEDSRLESIPRRGYLEVIIDGYR